MTTAAWERAKAPWILVIGIWIVYGTAAVTEGMMIFYPESGLTRALFEPFAENVDAAYRGSPFGDSLHKAFAVVDTLFGPVFCAAGLGLLWHKHWGLFLGFACGLTSLALLTVDLLTDVFGGFDNVLDPWVYGLTIGPYYLVAGSTVRYSLTHWTEGLDRLSGR